MSPQYSVRTLVVSAIFLTWTSVVEIRGQGLPPGGPYVCRVVEKQLQTRTVTYRKPEVYYTKEVCWAFPPVCTVKMTRYSIGYRMEKYSVDVTVHRCCHRYRVNKNNTCEAVCTNPCVHGRCVSPEKCQCDDGYSGADCSSNCPANTWGPNCANLCDCNARGTCDSLTGFCSCAAGWTGEHCQTKCPSGTFGKGCQSVCNCKQGVSCDPTTGVCICPSGFTGPRCEDPCPDGTHG